jgi:fumarylacetoacetate (FAA) hydrolase
MKLATLKTDQRDGKLVVVSKDLTRAIPVPHIAQTLQQALDHWSEVKAKLEEVYHQLNQGQLQNTLLFENQTIASPLPRAYQWADGSAYVNHVELVRKARGAEMPENFWRDPLMYQGGSDSFLGPRDPIVLGDVDWGLDFEAEVAVIVSDLPQGPTYEMATTAIQLLMLVNDVTLRNLIPNELSKGFGFFQSKPSSAFSPVAVTPDELVSNWDGKKLHLPLHSYLNGNLFGKPNAGVDMTFDFPTLIMHAAKTRPLSAGTIIGSGTVSNLDRSLGSSCIVEKRMLETLATGKPKTPYLQIADRVKIEMLDSHQTSIFGAIEQEVIAYSFSKDAKHEHSRFSHIS